MTKHLKPLPESILAAEISTEVQAVKNAKASLKAQLAAVQVKCCHRIVSEKPYQTSYNPAKRICNHCRIEETGSHWSGGDLWSRDDFQPPILGNEVGRIVIPISVDEFTNMVVRT